jgi:two-component sensor histidine kinase
MTWNEADRLAALRGYGILDLPTTEVFEDFVQIAAAVCGAPIAVVNFIDASRQWFAAEIGLGVRETPLDISICSHAILQPDVFVVPDLTKDSRFDRNPLVTGDPKLRFYGGALLETADGLPLGTMCVLDYAPRPNGLTERQAFTLKALARRVMAQLELRRAVAEKEALLAEKELLMQEVHHRVKNSLQMVQSLLTLQANATTDPEAARHLRQSAGRVHTFGSMHEHLYRVNAALRVDLAGYLRSLIDDQRESLASTLVGRTIHLNPAEASWPSSEAPTLGLIMVELVTNALKHGAGEVTVTLRETDNQMRMTVEDEGTELPADFEPSRGKRLGMRIVIGLLESRRGRLTIDRSRGHTCFVAELAVPEPGV